MCNAGSGDITAAVIGEPQREPDVSQTHTMWQKKPNGLKKSNKTSNTADGSGSLQPAGR